MYDDYKFFPNSNKDAVDVLDFNFSHIPRESHRRNRLTDFSYTLHQTACSKRTKHTLSYLSLFHLYFVYSSHSQTHSQKSGPAAIPLSMAQHSFVSLPTIRLYSLSNFKRIWANLEWSGR